MMNVINRLLTVITINDMIASTESIIVFKHETGERDHAKKKLKNNLLRMADKNANSLQNGLNGT